jgi:hypothetical protein
MCNIQIPGNRLLADSWACLIQHMHPTHGQDIMMLAYCNNKWQRHDATRTRHALHRVSCRWAKPANAIADQCTGTQLTQMACCRRSLNPDRYVGRRKHSSNPRAF